MSIPPANSGEFGKSGNSDLGVLSTSNMDGGRQPRCAAFFDVAVGCFVVGIGWKRDLQFGGPGGPAGAGLEAICSQRGRLRADRRTCERLENVRKSGNSDLEIPATHRGEGGGARNFAVARFSAPPSAALQGSIGRKRGPKFGGPAGHPGPGSQGGICPHAGRLRGDRRICDCVLGVREIR